ncbi:MAG: hypothetical protein H0T84_06370 [Tatlockia sp.]|nr:hypothetical protein [Tatlockia sp.]
MLRTVVVIFAIMWSFCVLAEDTELKFYRPFVNENQLVIKKTSSGECWHQSQRIKREDAWRCIAEGRVFDPCFIKPHGPRKEAICPDSPWTTSAVLINLSAPADNGHHIALDMSETYPWAVELTSGEKCQAVDEGQVYDGLQVHYQCNSPTFLIGRVQRCDAKWSILQRTATGISTVGLSKAWF